MHRVGNMVPKNIFAYIYTCPCIWSQHTEELLWHIVRKLSLFSVAVCTNLKIQPSESVPHGLFMLQYIS